MSPERPAPGSRWTRCTSRTMEARCAVVAHGTRIGYQWLRDGLAIAGATEAVYTTPATSDADHGSAYAVEVSNSGGSELSDAAVLAVLLYPPEIVAQPEAVAAVVGDVVA